MAEHCDHTAGVTGSSPVAPTTNPSKAVIAGYETERIRDDQVEVNVKAAEKMAKLHDTLKNHGYEGHDLEVYLGRLLFCLFANQ